MLWQSAARSGEWEKVLDLPASDEDAWLAYQMLTQCKTYRDFALRMLDLHMQSAAGFSPE